MTALLRYMDPEQGPRIGVRLEDTVYDVSERVKSVGAWLRESVGRVDEAIEDLVQAAGKARQSYEFIQVSNGPFDDRRHLLAPVDSQEVWAAGVTYDRSRKARQEEAVDTGDVYARVYTAERPELFFKSPGHHAVGHLSDVGIRHDSQWNVPEPELTLLVNPVMEIVGITIGNDMSSRDIEGANPLYLPQAKVYTASCALGPQVVLGLVESWPETTIRLTVVRAGRFVFEGAVDTTQIKRRPDELVRYLGRCCQFPEGAALMTGTGIVPDADFTLLPDDVVRIAIDGIGLIENRVMQV